MNAQKAIEQIEEHLNQTIAAVNSLKRWGERHSVDSLAHFQLIEEGQQRIEALSIVLTSAKVLHADGIQNNINESGYAVVERYIYGESFDRLGIEEGASND